MKNLINGFIMALSMFTILPVPYKAWKDDAVRHMMKLYPLVGIFVGLINYIVFKLTVYFNLSIILVAAITMLTPFVITGMLHLDGFMDVSDALLSRRDRDEKVRILKDPNTGAFSVISLGILFIIDFATTYTLVENKSNIVGIIIIPIISRSLMGLMLLRKESMKESSLGLYFKKGTGKVDILVLFIFLITSSFIFMFLGLKFILVPLGMIAIAILSVKKSIKELGGMSGDIAGYGLVLSEVLGILILSII